MNSCRCEDLIDGLTRAAAPVPLLLMSMTALAELPPLGTRASTDTAPTVDWGCGAVALGRVSLLPNSPESAIEAQMRPFLLAHATLSTVVSTQPDY